jgi:hypothetical protein
MAGLIPEIAPMRSISSIKRWQTSAPHRLSSAPMQRLCRSEWPELGWFCLNGRMRRSSGTMITDPSSRIRICTTS